MIYHASTRYRSTAVHHNITKMHQLIATDVSCLILCERNFLWRLWVNIRLSHAITRGHKPCPVFDYTCCCRLDWCTLLRMLYATRQWPSYYQVSKTQCYSWPLWYVQISIIVLVMDSHNWFYKYYVYSRYLLINGIWTIKCGI